MSRYAKATGSGGGFKPEFGIHNAVCCQLVDMGTHDKEWQGKVVGTANKINIGFEFIDIELDGENETYHPIWGQQETNSLSKKANLRKLLEGWRGKALSDEELKSFDLDKLLGLSCHLVIQPNSNGNPKITAISKAKTTFPGKRELVSFWFDEDFSGELPEWMPEWMKETIEDSEEWMAFHSPDEFQGEESVDELLEEEGFVEEEDDVPF